MGETRSHEPSNKVPDFEFCGWQGRIVLCSLVNREREIRVEPKVMALLACLAVAKGEIVPRETLMQKIWGHEHVTDDALNRLVARLRKFFRQKLTCTATIDTVAGVGYRLNVVVGAEDQKSKKITRIHPLWILAAVLSGLGAWWALFDNAQHNDAQQTRAVPLTSTRGQEIHPTLSPDGSHFAFAFRADEHSRWNIFVRQIESEARLQITDGPGDSRKPTWSPDGSWLAFLHYQNQRCEVRLVAPIGGQARNLAACDISHKATLAWTPDSKKLIYRSPGERGMFSLSIEGQHKKILTQPPATIRFDSDPSISPDGATLAFVRWTAPGAADVYIAPGEGGNARRLTHDNQKLHGLAWDVDSRHILFSSNRAGSFALWRVAVDGNGLKRLPVIGRSIDAPVVSRDGSRLLYQEWQEIVNLVTIDTTEPNSEQYPVTDNTRRDWGGQVSVDGKKIAFISERSGNTEVWLQHLETGKQQRLTRFDGAFASTPRWSPSLNSLVFDSVFNDGNADIYWLDISTGHTERITQHPAADRFPHFSPDGEYVYFGSQRSGDWQIWKRHIKSGSLDQVTTEGGYFSSVDDNGDVYFAKSGEAGVWRVMESGTVMLMTNKLAENDAVNWLVKQGILWFIEREENTAFLTKMNTLTGEYQRIVPLKRPFYKSGLSIDGQGKVYFATLVRYESDLMMMENF